MSIGESLRMAAKQTRKHPARSMLTILGIVIGIAVMTAVLSVGEAGQDRIKYELDKFGINRITVYADEYEGFKFGSIQKIEDRVAGVNNLSARSSTYGRAKSDTAEIICEIVGSSENALEVEHGELSQGRFLSKADAENLRRFAVIGEDLSKELFGTSEAKDKTFKLNGMTYTIVGVKKNEEQLYDASAYYQIYIPLTSFEAMYGGGIEQLSFEIKDKANISKTVDKVTAMLYENYPGTISVLDLSEQIKNADGIIKIVRLVLGAVAVMSLIVGGIGIMNIMLVTVRERKKEIGIRKALGAKDSDILRQFMCESVLYSLIGAAAGVVIGILMTVAAERIIGLDASVSVSSLVMSVVFSAGVGMAAGILPALKAAKLDPVEALCSH